MLIDIDTIFVFAFCITAQYRNPGILPYLTRRQSRKCKQTNSEEALSMLLCTDESSRVDQLHYIDVDDKVMFFCIWNNFSISFHIVTTAIEHKKY